MPLLRLAPITGAPMLLSYALRHAYVDISCPYADVAADYIYQRHYFMFAHGAEARHFIVDFYFITSLISCRRLPLRRHAGVALLLRQRRHADAATPAIFAAAARQLFIMLMFTTPPAPIVILMLDICR